MPTKKLAKKKAAVVTIPVSWLLAGALFLGAAMVVQAVNSNKKLAGINEVKTGSQGVVEGTYTGTVAREVANPNEKEKYVLTTDSGAKYILVGLKKSYENEEEKKKIAQVKEEQVKTEKAAGKPSTTKQKSPPKPDTEDTNSFEQYVGLKVTVVGLVVPVMSERSQKPLLPASSPQVKKNGSNDDPKVQSTERTGKVVKPVISPTPKKSQSPESGWDYDRLVVKAIAVTQ